MTQQNWNSHAYKHMFSANTAELSNHGLLDGLGMFWGFVGILSPRLVARADN